MSLNHLLTILWMRWRTMVNRLRRGGKLGQVLVGVLLVFGALSSVGLFVLALVLGLELLPDAEPLHLMLVWLGLALSFLFSWMIGLVTDLQRSDPMSFKNLLHLPVPTGWIFLYNYASSYVSLSVAMFLPPMLGLCLASVVVYGAAMLVTPLLVFAFLAMVTALTYQLRGWLSRLMENKRRARSIVMGITISLVALAQVPNLIQMGWRRSEDRERTARRVEQVAPSPDGGAVKFSGIRHPEERDEADVERFMSVAVAVIPVGWLPYGVRMAAEGRGVPSGLCLLGLLAIAGWSLRRSYRTTLAAFIHGPKVVAKPIDSLPDAVVQADRSVRRSLVQRSVPFCGEAESAIAFAALRSLLRAPEFKMMMLTPFILLGVFVLMFARGADHDWLLPFAPLVNLGLTTVALLSIIGLVQNQFGLDRDGFRAYVLSPVPRWQILRGKNLAVAPIGLGLGLLVIMGSQWFIPLDLEHFLGALPQLVGAFLLLCLLGNAISIFGPMRLRANGIGVEGAKIKAFIWQMLSMLALPFVLSPLMVPIGLESLLSGQAWAALVPIYLIGQVLGLVAILVGYQWVIRLQGEMFQEQERRMLEILTRSGG